MLEPRGLLKNRRGPGPAGAWQEASADESLSPPPFFYSKPSRPAEVFSAADLAKAHAGRLQGASSRLMDRMMLDLSRVRPHAVRVGDGEALLTQAMWMAPQERVCTWM